jgi:hypothetical protein
VDDGTAHAFGRVEGKLDRVADRIDGLAQKVAEHGVRLTHVEGQVGELKSAATADQRHGITVRGSILVGLTTVVASGAVTSLVNLFTR